MAERGEITFFKRAQIYSEPLVPLVKELESAVGKRRAHEITRNALRGWVRQMYRNLRAEGGKNPIDIIAEMIPVFARDAHEYDILQRTEDTLDFNVSWCKYAEFYQGLGEPELGYLLLCDLDFAMAEGLGEELEFRRTQTIMQGASHCDFRYRRRPDR